MFLERYSRDLAIFSWALSRFSIGAVKLNARSVPDISESCCLMGGSYLVKMPMPKLPVLRASSPDMDLFKGKDRPFY